MHHCVFLLLVALTLALGEGNARPQTPLAAELEKQFNESAAVVNATVLRTSPFVDETGKICTRAWLQVEETFKGLCPPVLTLVTSGGSIGSLGYRDGLSVPLRAGESRLFFLRRLNNGTLTPAAGPWGAPQLSTKNKGLSADSDVTALLAELRDLAKASESAGEDVTDQSGLLTEAQRSAEPIVTSSFMGGGLPLSNVLVDEFGYGLRYPSPDRGEPIPYLVDGRFLPAGINSNQALFAVRAAFNAWSNVSSARFVFAGWSNFDGRANALTNANGTPRARNQIYVQLHNAYNVGLEPGIIALGGSFFTTYVLSPGWGSGGCVAGNEFNQSLLGFVILGHTNVALQNTNNFAEALCHEIGHVLGLAHTSENPAEPTNSPLRQSIMYYQLRTNRGAVLGAIDGPNLRQIHPTNNTPPAADARYLDVVTGNPLPTNAGVNTLELRIIDLQGQGSLSAELTDPFGTNGVFSLNGNTVAFTPFSLISTLRLDPASGFFYDQIYYRVSDGTNASPFYSINTISFNPDTFPPGQPDGLPDNFMFTYFGNPDPAAGPGRGPNDDADGDGFTNLQEFLSGTSPTDSTSLLRILTFSTNAVTFSARPYDLYELETSTNMTGWSPVGFAFQATNSPGVFTNFNLPASTGRYFRVRRVP